MTVSTEITSVVYSGNGVTTAFPFPALFFTDADLVVTQIDPLGNNTTLVITSDYTVEGENDELGGTVNMVVAPATGYQLRIERVLDYTQETEFDNQGAFYAQVHEAAFDKLTMLVQQVRDSGVTEAELDAAISEAIASVVAGSYNPVTSTGSLTARTLEDRFAETRLAEDFGASPAASAADNKFALDAAVAACPIGGTVEFRTPGTYTIQAASYTRKIGKLRLARGVRLRLGSAPPTHQGIVHFAGAEGAVTTLSGTAVPGQMAVSLNSMTGIAYGVTIRIENLSLAATGARYEFRKVLAFSGSTVYLMSPIVRNSYPSGANGKVTVMDMWDGLVVEGGDWDGNDLPDSSGVTFQYCANPVLKPDRVEKVRYYGAAFASCVNPVVLAQNSYWESSKDCDLADAGSLTTHEAGYAVTFHEGTQNGQVYGGTFVHWRHPINVSNGAYDAISDGAHVFGAYSNALLTHFQRAGHVQFTNFHIEGATYRSASALTLPAEQAGVGFSTTDTRCTVGPGHCMNVKGPAVTIVSNSGAQASYCKILPITAEDCYSGVDDGHATIYAVDCDKITILPCTILRNDALGFQYPAIRLVRCDDAIILAPNITYTATQTGGGTQSRGVHFVDCLDPQVLGGMTTFDGTGVAYKMESTSPGATNGASWIGVKQKITGGGTPTLFVANCTNTFLLGNNWAGGQGAFTEDIVVGADGGGARSLSVNGATGSARDFRWLTDSIQRVIARLDSTDGFWELIFYDAAGTLIDKPIRIAIAAGGDATFLRRLVTLASSSARAGLNLPHGAAPTTPVNGDVWTTTAGIFVRINGATVGPLT